VVISRTPLRVSFAGGGSDLASYADEHGGAVLSTTIDQYIYVIVSERFEDSLRVSYSETEIVDRVDDLQHELIREALKIAGVRRKLEIVTVADVPSRGTGLGSSSAVTVGTLNALFAFQGILKSGVELAEAASHIEIDILGKPIGRQDQYATALGGLQLLEFDRGGAVRPRLVPLASEIAAGLERNLLMFYTGRQRSASSVLAGIDNEIGPGATVNDGLDRIRDQALELFGRIARGAPPEVLGKTLHANWELKRSLRPGVSDPYLDELYSRALDHGAVGGKILGAGGGGFLLLYVEDEHQSAVRAALRDLRELVFRFDRSGSTIIHIGR
jgi:D-glycero-alpha-D-manno-heptose-7-phosphate kinase